MKIAIRNGLFGTIALLSIYAVVISLLSGFDFMLSQFYAYWYFVISLAMGFGIQVGLYSYLKNAIRKTNSSGRAMPAARLPAGQGRQVLAVSGTTSTAAMISCCAHYLVNLLPIIGAIGIITIVSQYQVKLFWIGLASNFIGILYMLNRVIKYTRRI